MTRAAAAFVPGALHCRRLREIWRSAGWPCCDMVEVELLCAGLLERVVQPSGHQTLRVTDAGVALLGDALARNRRARDAHEALVETVARAMVRAGRLAWRGLSLRAKVGHGTPDERWAMAMPDVYSIRNTTVEAYLEPVVHEIKVRRADLLSDLRNPCKREAYLQLGGECWYVLADGIAEPHEVPAECGVIVAATAGAGSGVVLDVARPAPKRGDGGPFRMPLGVWMALARATPLPGWRDDEAQGWLAVADAAGGSAKTACVDAGTEQSL